MEEKTECPDLFFWPNIGGALESALRDMLEDYARCVLFGVDFEILPPQEILSGIKVASNLVQQSHRQSTLNQF